MEPVKGMMRPNGDQIEYYDGESWVTLRANIDVGNKVVSFLRRKGRDANNYLQKGKNSLIKLLRL